MNPELNLLQPYPFEKLAQLKRHCTPPAHLKAINLSLGEPQQATPAFIIDAMCSALASGIRRYPTTQGHDELRQSIAHWLIRRFHLAGDDLDHKKHILPVNGTREALFAFAQCIIDRRRSTPRVLMPNPFYQIYEGAALLAGAQPWFIHCLAEKHFQPDFTAVPIAVWEQCQLLYLCSPHNPTGYFLDQETLQNLLEYADKYQFVIAADECYSELYADKPPLGLLQACAAYGRTDFKRCIVFHSLSKRSHAPGLRSGFVAGDADIIAQFLRYRTYQGCAMPLAVQAASQAAWADETHVQRHRAAYQQKYKAVLDILAPVMSVTYPPAGFYLWLETPVSENFHA
jgi:N-succinyldiaminopimelate aminotransferase